MIRPIAFLIACAFGLAASVVLAMMPSPWSVENQADGALILVCAAVAVMVLISAVVAILLLTNEGDDA